MAEDNLYPSMKINQDGVKPYHHRIESKAHFNIIYVVAPGPDGPCKIGITKNIARRLSNIQTGCWERVAPYGFRFGLRKRYNTFENSMAQNLEDGARQLERIVLSKVKELDLSLFGEWVDLTPTEALQVIDKCGQIGDVASVSLENLSGAEVNSGLDASMVVAQRRLVLGALEITGLIQNLNGIGDGIVDME